MQHLTCLTVLKNVKQLTMLLKLLLMVMMITSCSSLTSHTPSWPTNLEVIKLSDGGVCLSPESAKRLAEFRADLESL